MKCREFVDCTELVKCVKFSNWQFVWVLVVDSELAEFVRKNERKKIFKWNTNRV